MACCLAVRGSKSSRGIVCVSGSEYRISAFRWWLSWNRSWRGVAKNRPARVGRLPNLTACSGVRRLHSSLVCSLAVWLACLFACFIVARCNRPLFCQSVFALPPTNERTSERASERANERAQERARRRAGSRRAARLSASASASAPSAARTRIRRSPDITPRSSLAAGAFAQQPARAG